MEEEGSFKLRTFNQEDIDKILDIEEQSFPKTAYPKEDLLNFAEDLPDGFVVIEKGGDIAGYIIFAMNGHILSMAVKPQYRRKRLGTALFKHALQRLGRTLQLEVRSKNRGAILFYTKLGMRILGKIPGYYADDDALVMVLNGRHQ
jgi:ribosomal-protein-alanine N-acetyltransferase